MRLLAGGVPICLAVVLGCDHTRKINRNPGPESSPDYSPALVPVHWMVGAWKGDHGTEAWFAVDGAFFGVGFGNDGSFDVMIVDDAEGPGKADGMLRFYAMPNGSSQVEFKQRELGATKIVFANPAHDFPKTIEYRKRGEGIAAQISDDAAKKIDFHFEHDTAYAATDLEAADRAFAEDTAKRGVAGWVAAFADDGGMLKKGTRIQGHAAIAEHMGPLLGSGTLARHPVASGKSWQPFASAGKLGFTVGKATYQGRPAETRDSWRSSYVTIWKQTDAGWKVVFDAARVVNE